MRYGFASVQVLLNEICKAFSLNQHKAINTSIKSGLLTKYELDKSLGDIQDGLIEHTPLMSKPLYRYIENLVSDYLEVVSRVQSTGIPRPHLIQLLNLRYFGLSVKLCEELSSYMITPLTQSLYDSSVSAINLTINRLERIPGWFEFYKTLDKEKKDHLALWASGRNLPSTVKLIKSWGDSNFITDDSWKLVISSLNLAKALDTLKRTGFLISHDKLPQLQADDFYIELYTNFHDKNYTRLNDLSELHELFHSETSKEYIKKKSRDVIDDVYELLKTSPSLKHYHYHLKRADAHWNVFNGELKRAGEIYKRLIIEAQYIAGPQLKEILEEALVIGAQQKSPDKVLLRNAYNLQVLFGFQEDHVNDKGIISKKYGDNVEVWLERYWKKQFSRIFPSKVLFEGVDYVLLPSIPTIGPSDGLERPDYRNPNRMVKVKVLGRAIPQINYWIGKEEVDVAKKLLDKGADVLISSDQNETPLIAALQQTDKYDDKIQLEWKKLVYLLLEKLIKLSSNQENQVKTYINSTTQKNHLRAIELAIDSKEPLIVESIVQLGANINSEETYSSLPLLYSVLGRLADLKDNDSRISNNTDIEKLRKICAILIINGADVNQEVILSNGLHYSPLALCAEINELTLFRLMLEHNGNIHFTYIDKITRNRVNLRDIASYFKSKDIMLYLASSNI